MIKIILLGIILITINVVLQAIGNVIWVRKTTAFFQQKKHKISNKGILKLLVLSFLSFTLLHILHTAIWASLYYFSPFMTNDFTDFAEAMYFSFVTFTTLGYGDITITSQWKLLSGFEAINGIMLIGWSTAMMYSLIQHVYKELRR